MRTTVDFKTATDRLGALGVTHAELGAALGVAASTVRAARLDPTSESYRNPPEKWRPILAGMAEARGREFVGLAEELES